MSWWKLSDSPQHTLALNSMNGAICLFFGPKNLDEKMDRALEMVALMILVTAPYFGGVSRLLERIKSLPGFDEGIAMFQTEWEKLEAEDRAQKGAMS